jgi:hypothetical protein
VCRRKSGHRVAPTDTEHPFGIVNLAEVTERAGEYAYVDSDDLAAHIGDHEECEW